MIVLISAISLLIGFLIGFRLGYRHAIQIIIKGLGEIEATSEARRGKQA